MPQRAQSSLVLPGADGDRRAGAEGDALQPHNGHAAAQQPEQRHQVLRQQQVGVETAVCVCVCVSVFTLTQCMKCVCVQWYQRDGAGVRLPKRSIRSEPV